MVINDNMIGHAATTKVDDDLDEVDAITTYI